MKRLILCAALAVSACSGEKPPASERDIPATQASSAATTPSGPAVTISPRSPSEQGADVNVARVEAIGDDGARLFSTIGGDPAINGEYLFLVIPSDEAPMEDAKVYKLGDFNSWALESQSAGQIVIKVSRSWLNDAGEVQTADERYLVAIPAGSADTTTMTPVR